MELNPQNMEVNEDDEEMFDYNNIDSEIKADSDNNFKEEEHPRDEDGKFTKVSEEHEQKKNKDKDNDKNAYKVNVSKLPKDLQDIGEKLYSGKYGSCELGYADTSKPSDSEVNKNHRKKLKLSKLENKIVKYMEYSDENRFSKKCHGAIDIVLLLAIIFLILSLIVIYTNEEINL